MFCFKTKKPFELTDEQLFKGVCLGNNTFFEEIYGRYNKRLLYYFFRMLGNNQDLAQDFLQELFYKILNKPQLFNSKKKFSTWIFSIAHNMCKNEYRSREVRKIIVKNENLDSLAYQETIETASDSSVKQIYSELEKLDESHRSAFLLKYREGLDISEISEILELPPGTIKSRLFYTRKKIYASICNNKKEIEYEYKANSDDRFR